MSERPWSEQQCLEGSLRVPGIAQPLTVTRNTGGGRASLYPVAAPARVVGDHTIELKLGRRTNFHDNHKPIRNGGRVFLSDECVEGRYATECRKLAPGDDLVGCFPCAKGACYGCLRRGRPSVPLERAFLPAHHLPIC